MPDHAPNPWVRELLRLDRSLLSPGAAARAALGVGLVLAVAVTAGSPASAVAAAAGAFSVGIASIQGAYLTRVQATVATSVAMAVSTFVGALISRNEVVAVLVTALWAGAAGIATALGPAGTVVGLQAVVALLIAGDFAMTTRAALVRSLLVLAGGLAQTVLVIALWPLRSYAAERTALAAVYRSLHDYAAAGDPAGADATVLPPTAAPFTAAADVLGDPHPLGRDGTRAGFRALLDLAGRTRLELAALTHARARARVRARPDQVHHIDAVLAEAAEALSTIAGEVAPWLTRALLGTPGTVTELVPLEGLRPSVVASVQALRGQLRAQLRVVTGLGTRNGPDVYGLREQPSLFAVGEPHLVPPLAEPLLTLRAALHPDTETARHALRLAAVVLVASLVYHATALPHGYWVAITALVVLRPDFSSTMSRGVGRVIGTALGALAATAVAAEVRPNDGVLIVLIAGCAFAGYTIFRANQAVFAAFLTGYVVFLLALVGLPGAQAALDRLLDTVIGGALALLAYALWPTWERGRVPDQLATLVESQSGYACAVLAAYASATARSSADLDEAQATTRRARASAEASVQRYALEPAYGRAGSAGPQVDPRVAEGVIAAGQRTAQAVLSLHARLPGPGDEELPAVDLLVEDLRRAGQSLAQALRAGSPPQEFPHLRAVQIALADRLGDTTLHRRLVALETDLVVDALDTIAHLLGRQEVPEVEEAD